VVPTSRLLWILILGIPFTIVPLVSPPLWPLPLAMWALIGVAATYDMTVLGVTRLQVTPMISPHLGVGSTPDSRCEVQMVGPVALHARVRVVVEAPLASGPISHTQLHSGTVVLPLSLSADRRGTGFLDSVWLELAGPLRLFNRIVRSAPDARRAVAVVPDARRVDDAVVKVFGAQPMVGGLKREKWSGEGSEFESLHQYVAGMDLDAVDWKASSRHGQVRVRRFHVERRQRVTLCLDVGRAMRDPIEGLERLDHAVHTAFVLAKASLRAGDLVGVHAYSSEPRSWVPARGGPAQFARIRRACAELSAEADETNHVLGLHALLQRSPRRSLVIVFTEFADATTAELMLDAIGQLARRHVIMFVALDDPELEEPLAHQPKGARDLAAAIVTSHLSRRRQLVLAKLARLGVHVVHSRPGSVAADAVNAYVQIKRRGLIG
jgi:uncharacterized protein (DUF58 family)